MSPLRDAAAEAAEGAFARRQAAAPEAAAPGSGWAAPSLRFRDRLVPAFDEDALTLLWDAARAASLAPGARVALSGIEAPAWFWSATGLVPDLAGTPLRIVAAAAGTVAVAGRGDPDAIARRAWQAARELDAAQHARLAAAVAGGQDAEQPMGAFVVPARHEEVLVQRLRAGPARVASWTRIGAGAAPSEFGPFQDAGGDFHVVLASREAGGATVAMWAGTRPPAVGDPCVPVLRRLFRQQGAWRYGAKMAPA